MYTLDDIQEIARVTHLKNRTERETFGAIYNKTLHLYRKLQYERIKFTEFIESSFSRRNVRIQGTLSDYYDAYNDFVKSYCQLSQFSFNAQLEDQ